MAMALRWLCLFALLNLLGCTGCNSANLDPPKVTESGAVPENPSGVPALSSPRELSAFAPPQNPLAFEEGRLLYGAYALEQLGGNLATSADDHLLALSPTSGAGESALDDLAWGTFVFNMEYYTGEGILQLGWEVPPVDPASVFVGLGNFTGDHWDWFSPVENAVALADLADYIDAENNLLLTVALTGNEPASLKTVRIGERWIYAGVDLTELLAPPMQYEIQQVRDNWATRNPVDQDYVYVGEEVQLDGVTHAVISHTVDGLTNYGGLRIPPNVPGEKFPLLMVCHPGSGGAGLSAAGSWITGIVSEGFFDEFIIVVPAYRSETLSASGIGDGSFTSEGEESMYDRDADDAIALLDSVIKNIPQADGSNVFTAGYSTGAEIALRVAQREPRVSGSIEFAGFTDEWLPSNQAIFPARFDIYNTEPPAYDFYHYMYWELQNGTTDIWSARQVLLLTSVAYFADTMAPTQIHHGVNDTTLPVEYGDRMNEMLEATPGAIVDYHRYETAGHFPGSMNGAGAYVEEFINGLITVE